MREVVRPDKIGWIEPMWIRHLLYLSTGKYHTVEDGIAALAKIVPTGYVVRRSVSKHGRRICVFRGAVLSSPKRLMRFLCQRFKARGKNDDHRRAYVHFKRCDWKQFPDDEKRIWERWVLFGEFPHRIAYHLGLHVDYARAVITRHRLQSGIQIAWNGDR